MSLNSKQIREMQSLYESVYAPKDEKVNFIFTNEEFEELCTCILVETFNSVVLDEVTKKMAKDAVTNPKIRDLAVKGLTKIFKPETVKGGITRFGGTALGVDALTGGKTNKRLGATVNPRNLYGYIKGMFTAADKGMQGSGSILKDKKGNYYTTDQARKKDLNNSFEFDSFNLYICEANSKEDLINQLNKDKDKNKNNKDNTNVAGEGSSGNGAQGGSNGAQGGTSSGAQGGTSGAQGGTSGTQGGTSGTQGGTSGTQGKTNGAQGGSNGAQGGTSSGAQGGTSGTQGGSNGAQGTKTPYTPNFKDIEKYTSKDDIPTMKDFDSSKNEIKKDKPKQYSTPVKDKTDLGSPIKSIKPGSARDIARARNEITFGADHVGKLVNKTADYKAYKRGDITKQQFADKYPNSQTAKALKKSKLPPSVMDFESYQPYDLVLDYIITEGHADTVEEAHYVMTQMDAETIQTIIAEYEIV